MKDVTIIIRNIIFTDKVNGICWKVRYPKDCDEIEFFKNIEEQLINSKPQKKTKNNYTGRWGRGYARKRKERKNAG